MNSLIGIAFMFVAVAISLGTQISAQTNITNCYYGSWAKYRTGIGYFPIQLINAELCTHITYAFIGLNSDGSINPNDSTIDMPTFLTLKQQNPDVKLLVAMGGSNEGSTTFSTVTNNDNLRAVMVNNIYNFLIANKLDGFDLDWEYPAEKGGIPSDKVSFINLLRDLRQKFSGTNLLLTAAVAAIIQNYGNSYDVPNMNKYLDYFNIMSYDYHGSWESVTGQNAPLYPSSVNPNGLLNGNASIYGWIQAGAHPQKILFGTAFYGRSFTLTSSSNAALGAPITGPGTAGPITQDAGMLNYLEICDELNLRRWTTVFDNQQRVPYAYSGNQWVGYDNPRSLQIKTQYAISLNLAGIMIWSLESDDANNYCGNGAYPLLNMINRTLPTIVPTIQPPQPTQLSTVSIISTTSTSTNPFSTPPTAIPTTPTTSTIKPTTSTTRLTTTTIRPSTPTIPTSTHPPLTPPTATPTTPTTSTTKPTTSTTRLTTTTTKPTTPTTTSTTSTTRPTTTTTKSTTTTTRPTTTTTQSTTTTTRPTTTTTRLTTTTTRPTTTTTRPTTTTTGPTTTTTRATTTTTRPTTTTTRPTTTTTRPTTTTTRPTTTTTRATTTTTRPTTTTTRATTTTTRPTTTTTRPRTTTTRPTTTTTRPTTTTTRPTTTTTRPTTTTSRPTTHTTPTTIEPNVCRKTGTFRHATDCRFFYQCVDNGWGGYIRYMFQCPANLYFSLQYYMCLYQMQVPECK